MATKPKLIALPARKTAEPEIVRDHALAEGLKRHRSFNKRGYDGIEVWKECPALSGKDAELRDALRRWRETPPDLADAHAVGEALASVFPGSRVSAVAYGQGLAAIAEDDCLTADIVRAVARRVRAESPKLPPLAELRTEALAERNARRGLLFELEIYEERHAAEVEAEGAAVVSIVTGAARTGVVLSAQDVLDAWGGFGRDGWFHKREANPPRTRDYFDDWIFRAVERGLPQARQAAELLQVVAPYERDFQAAWEARALDDASREARDTFYAEMPEPRDRFSAECDALAEALGLRAGDTWREAVRKTNGTAA